MLVDLVAGADVFLQNYRPGRRRSARRRSTIPSARSRPDIVYVSISGYGETGPYVSRPGQDILLQAMSGALYSSGTQDRAPQPAPYFLADAITAYSAFEGVLAALLHRERTGQGQLVQVNMLDALIAMQTQELSVRTVGGVRQQRGARDPRAQLHPGAVRHLPDERRLSCPWRLAIWACWPTSSTIRHWPNSTPSGTASPTVTTSPERSAATSAPGPRPLAHDARSCRCLGRTGLRLRRPAGGPAGRAQRLLHHLRPPHRGHGDDARLPVPDARSPRRAHRPAPTVGQHTAELLTELGRTEEQIDELRRGRQCDDVRSHVPCDDALAA